MSTRACIARTIGPTWLGYYVHSEGQPSWTGRAVVELARAAGTCAVWERAAQAPQGWTQFPDEPSIYHDEPFIISPEEHGGIEWLYLLEGGGTVLVYRADHRIDRGPDDYTHVGTIDLSHPDAVADMVALTDVRHRAGFVGQARGPDRKAVTAIPPHGIRTTPDGLVMLVAVLTNGVGPYEPTQDEIDAWLVAMAEDRGEA
jgi:hypothetical protein